jgi:4-aminobutyrate aminotransferase/(S)-3-amino-2-methylpropionate transaminase
MPNEEILLNLSKVECPDSTSWEMIPPLALKSGKGSMVKDIAGKKYIDLIAGFGSLPLGHLSEPFRDVLKTSLSDDFAPLTQGLSDLYPTEDKLDLLTQLIKILPHHLVKASLALTGSQAVEAALKTAILYTGKHGFISFKGGYHGVEMGALAVTANPYFANPFKGFVQPNSAIKLPLNCNIKMIEEAISALKEDGRGFAAMIVEPIQGRAGIIPAEKSWLKALKTIADQFSGLVIFDEIFTGLGRTGRLLSTDAVSHITLLGKALGGGLPLSACVGTEEVMQVWPRCTSEAIHTGTFFGYPLACRTGLATLNIIKNDDFLKTVAAKGRRALDQLKSSLRNKKGIIDIRGDGLFIAIEFEKQGKAVYIAQELRKKGVLVLPSGEKGEVLSLTPALNIPMTLLEKSCSEIIETLMSEPSSSGV